MIEAQHTNCSSCGIGLAYAINKATGYCNEDATDCAIFPLSKSPHARALGFSEPDPMVDHPEHYNHGPIECIDAIEAALGEDAVAYYRGVIIKYAWRMMYKGKTEQDAGKLAWYSNRLVQVLEKQRCSSRDKSN